jgi:hypothetical protein
MKIILTGITLMFYVSVSAQSNSSKKFSNFIPHGYSILDTASGDLDKDGFRDMVLILKVNDESKSGDTTRPLLLLSGDGKGSYRLLARNDSVVLCKECGGAFGDPYQGLTVKNGYFSIEHYGGSSWKWTRIITFKYDTLSKQFKLHRDAGVSFHASDPNKTTTTLTNKQDFGKLSFSRYSNDKF